jgi:hypothetical protein
METVGRCVRVQALEGYLDKIRSMTFSDDYTALLAVRHGGNKGENAHYHIVVRTGIQDQAFRKRMKTLFPDGKGNEHMSIKPWDGDDRALSYLFHEDPDCKVIIRKGITDEYEAKLREKNLQILNEVANAKKKASWTLEEDAYQHFAKNGPDTPYRKTSVDEIAIYMVLLSLREGKYMPQPWLLRSMVYKVQFRLLQGHEHNEEEFARALVANIFSR